MSAIHATLKRVLGFCGIGESYINQYINKPNSKFYFGKNLKKQLVLTHGQGQRTGYPNKPSSAVNQWVVGSLFSPSDASDWEGRIFDFKTALEVLRSQPVTAQVAVPSAPTLPAPGQSLMMTALQNTFDVNAPIAIEVGKTYVLNGSAGAVSFSSGNGTSTARVDTDVIVRHELSPGSYVVSLASHSSYVTTVDRSRLKDKNDQLFNQIEKFVKQLTGVNDVQKNELMFSIRTYVKHFTK